MSILSGPEIERIVAASAPYDSAKGPGFVPPLPHIKITPFDPARCGSNSYDVSLSSMLRVYGIARIVDNSILFSQTWDDLLLDPRIDNRTTTLTIPSGGVVLRPGKVYLGSTNERTQCSGIVPWLDGRSSIGRLGINIHATAGRGDDGFGEQVEGGCSWTLEITVAEPVWVYPGLVIGQLSFFTLVGERRPYRGRYQIQTAPTASQLWQG